MLEHTRPNLRLAVVLVGLGLALVLLALPMAAEGQECFTLTVSHEGLGTDPDTSLWGDGTVWGGHLVDGGFESARRVWAGDINGDGEMDLLGGGREGVAWWENDPAGKIKHVVDGGFDVAESVHTADMDGDGDTDVLAGASCCDDQVSWWENIDGTGTVWIEHVVTDFFDASTAVRAADMDGDGDLDVVGSAWDADLVAWFENLSGDGSTWQEHTVDGNFDKAWCARAADVDGDGDLDILGAAVFDNDITWWENSLGNGESWIEHLVDGDIEGPRSVHAADVDEDGDIDIVGSGVPGTSWWENLNGRGSKWIEHTVGVGTWFVHAADMDGDGDLDILNPRPHMIWEENVDGDGLTWIEHTVDADFVGYSVHAEDLDGDGDMDITAPYESRDDVKVWLNLAPRKGECPEGQYQEGDLIGLTANPDSGWRVGAWSGTDDDIEFEPVNRVTMPAGNTHVTVTYVENPSITLAGVCPGEINISVEHVTPNDSIGAFGAASEGRFLTRSETCRGTEIHLEDPTFLALAPTGKNGEFSTALNVPPSACGGFLQVVDVATCTPSNVAPIP